MKKRPYVHPSCAIGGNSIKIPFLPKILIPNHLFKFFIKKGLILH